MRIEFELQYSSKDEMELRNDFCSFIVNNIKNDILRNINMSKILSKEYSILNASWISWINKPTSINFYSLIDKIVDSITFITRENSEYVILLNRKSLIPNSNTRLEKLARFIDKGNSAIKGTYFISSIFTKYEENIQKYWKRYVSFKLKRYDINNAVIIR